ncbi:hypothetical protein ACU686_04395 [Yinghuangia aomiensis]
MSTPGRRRPPPGRIRRVARPGAGRVPVAALPAPAPDRHRRRRDAPPRPADRAARPAAAAGRTGARPRARRPFVGRRLEPGGAEPSDDETGADPGIRSSAATPVSSPAPNGISTPTRSAGPTRCT